MTPLIAFGPFLLDREKRRLLRGGTPVELRRKAWDVLCHLAERPGAVVSNDELLTAVWPGIAVTPQTLTNVIREIRLALAGPADGFRWVQTVRGRGHVLRQDAAPGRDTSHQRPVVVARDREHERLRARWTEAVRGTARLVFVTGEPGIGKTTLVDALAHDLPADDGATVRIGRGACIEQHGEPESFLPFLSAFEQLASGANGREVVAILRRAAPTWLHRLPHLLRPDERLRIEPSLVGATATRMLREGIGALRDVADTAPILLVVEDLHWADLATLDLLRALARTPGPFRLLVVATFRRADAAMRDHPVTALARDLRHERHADEIALGPFDAAAVGSYLTTRLGAGTIATDLAARLESLSAGNPLFLGALVDELVENGAFTRGPDGWRAADDADRMLEDLPESLRAFVASETARLPHPLRRIVEAASVIGPAVLVPELAVMLARTPAEVTEACEQLATIGRLLRRAGEAVWHDGRTVGRYAFPHASHRRIVYDGLSAHDRAVLHRKLADGLDVDYGPRAPLIAARLAAHCERGGLPLRAIDHHEHASDAAEARFAYREAVAHLEAALAGLDRLAAPALDASPRAGMVCLRLGELSVLAHGYSRPEVERAYTRALAIFETAAMPLGVFTAAMGLGVVDLTRARYRAAEERTRRLAGIAAAGHDELTPIACCWAGFASSALGALPRARVELEAGIAHGGDPGLARNFSVARMLRSQLALVQTVRGEHADASRLDADALARSHRHGAVPELAHAGLLAAERAVFLGDPAGRTTTAAALALAEANGLASYAALLRVYDAFLARDAGPDARVAAIRAVLAERDALSDRWHHALLLGLLATVALDAGRPADAQTAIDEAFAHVAATEECYYEAELWRLRAECALAASSGASAVAEARTWLTRAIEVAHAQEARLWEDRARARLLALAGPRRPQRGRRRTD